MNDKTLDSPDVIRAFLAGTDKQQKIKNFELLKFGANGTGSTLAIQHEISIKTKLAR